MMACPLFRFLFVLGGFQTLLFPSMSIVSLLVMGSCDVRMRIALIDRLCPVRDIGLIFFS